MEPPRQFAGFTYEEDDIPVEEVRPSSSQPYRHEPTSKKFLDLVQDLGTKGLLQPIDVVKVANGFELIEGHGRTQAAQVLDWKRIRARVFRTDDPIKLRIDLIGSTDLRRKMSGAQWIEFLHREHRSGTDVLLKSSAGYVYAAPNAALRTYAFMLKHFPLEEVDRLVATGRASPDAYNAVMAYARAEVGAGRQGTLDQDRQRQVDAIFPRAFRWIIEQRMVRATVEWVRDLRPRSEITRAIKEKRPLPKMKQDPE